MSDKLRLAWDVVCGRKVSASVHEKRAALLQLRAQVDRKIEELGGEVGHMRVAEEAKQSFPPPSPSQTGEQVGHSPPAEMANATLPPASPAGSDDVGHHQFAGDGPFNDAPSSTPNKAGEGQSLRAHKSHPAHAPPALVPTAAQRSGAARAMVSAAPKAVARTILDTQKMRGEIAVGDVRYAALLQIRDSDEWEIAFVEELLRFGIPPDRSMRIRDYLTADQVLAAKKAADKRRSNAA